MKAAPGTEKPRCERSQRRRPRGERADGEGGDAQRCPECHKCEELDEQQQYEAGLERDACERMRVTFMEVLGCAYDNLDLRF